MKDEVFKRGKSYLKLIKDVNLYISLYECLVCGCTKEIYKNKVIKGYHKTCGCRNGLNNNIEFFICKDGKIRSQTGLIMNSSMAKGYEGVTINNRTYYVHRLVAEKFIPNPLNLPDVNHINGNKKDNRVENLEWCNRSENIKHAIDNGLKVYKKGLKSPKRKFSDSEIKYIRESMQGSTTIARELKVSKTTIQNIRNGKIYK